MPTNTAPVWIAAFNATGNEQSMANASGGSICSGVNDYANIQVPEDAAYTTELSSGLFHLGISTVAVKYDGQILMGMGRRRTIVDTMSQIDMITFNPGAGRGNYSDTSVRGCVLRDLTLRGNNADGYNQYTNQTNLSANRGIYGRYACELMLLNVEVAQMRNWGVQVHDASGHDYRLYNTWIHDCGTSVWASGGGTYSGGLKIGSEYSEVNQPGIAVHSDGFIIENCYDNIWVVATTTTKLHGVFESAYRHGVAIDAQGSGYGMYDVNIDNAYFEQVGDFIRGGDDFHIVGYGVNSPYFIKIGDCFPSSTARKFISVVGDPLAAGFVMVDVQAQRIGNGIDPGNAHFTGRVADEHLINELDTGRMTNGTGAVTGSPVTISNGVNTPVVTAAGTFNIWLPSGANGTAVTGGWTVSASPVTLLPGNNLVTVTAGGSGTITVNMTDLFGAAGLTNSSVCFVQPANTILEGVEITNGAYFGGSGLTSVTITVGDAGSQNGLMTVTGNLVNDPPGTIYRTKGAYLITSPFTGGEYYAATAHNWSLYVTSVGCNLNALTLGKIHTYFKYRYA